MSVIYCFRCGRHSDTDFRPCSEAVNKSGEVELICESCSEEVEVAELEGRTDEYTLIIKIKMG